MRLGLIEATSRSASISRQPRIRGACASASLKRGQFGRPVSAARPGIRGACASASLKPVLIGRIAPRDRETHPRRVRLGLIEAGTSVVTKTSQRKHPRRVRLGLIEARTASRTRPGPERRIRGACASASLKQGAGSRALREEAGHPRRVRLGLIEAGRAAHTSGRAPEASEARAPPDARLFPCRIADVAWRRQDRKMVAADRAVRDVRTTESGLRDLRAKSAMRVQPGRPDCSSAGLRTSLGDAGPKDGCGGPAQSETVVPPKVGFET